MNNTDKLINELAKLMSSNAYSKEYIKERLDNLAAIAKLEAQIEEHKRIQATFTLGQVGLIEPEENTDHQL